MNKRSRGEYQSVKLSSRVCNSQLVKLTSDSTQRSKSEVEVRSRLHELRSQTLGSSLDVAFVNSMKPNRNAA